MDVIVTGSEGYLGCVLWRALKERGHRVRGIDRGLYGVRNFDDERAFERADAVVNLAGLVGETVCARNPGLVQRTNVEFAAKQLKKSIADCVKVFVQVSTTRVYGNREAGSAVNDESSVGVVSELPVYAGSKLRAENVLLDTDSRKTRLHVLRLGDMCGPSQRMRFDQTANGIALAIARGRKVVLQNPSNVRSYVSVRACANAICWLLENKAKTVLNFTGKARTIEDIAGVCARALPGKSRVERDTAVVADGLNYAVECSDELKHIEDGVDASIAYIAKEVYHYRWAGARADAREWGNVGWRW